MAGGQFSLAKLFGITLRESANDGSDFTNPDADYRRLFLGEDGKLHVKDSAGSVTEPWDAGSGAPFKFTTRISNGDYTTTSTSKTPIDATNLAYLTHTLEIGDVVRCTLNATGGQNTGLGGLDFEVDQPTSANVYIGNSNDNGLVSFRAPDPVSVTCVGMFTATEAGIHGFRPVWMAESGFQARLRNASSGASDNAIIFIVEKLGAPA